MRTSGSDFCRNIYSGFHHVSYGFQHADRQYFHLTCSRQEQPIARRFGAGAGRISPGVEDLTSRWIGSPSSRRRALNRAHVKNAQWLQSEDVVDHSVFERSPLANARVSWALDGSMLLPAMCGEDQLSYKCTPQDMIPLADTLRCIEPTLPAPS